jgi:hypothetical protein
MPWASFGTELLAAPLLIACWRWSAALEATSLQGRIREEARLDARRWAAVEGEHRGHIAHRFKRATSYSPAHPLGAVRLGCDVETGLPVDLTHEETRRGVTILGVPGSGKTTTIAVLSDGRVAAGHAVVLVDLKGTGLRSVAMHAAERHRVPFRLVDPLDPDTLGLAFTGDAPDIANHLASGIGRGEGNAAFYGDAARVTLTAVIAGLQAEHKAERLSLASILAPMASPAALRELGRAAGGTIGQRLMERADAIHGDRSISMAVRGLSERLTGVALGRFQRLFEENRALLDWSDAFGSVGVTYLSLPTLAATGDTAVMSQFLLGAILQECHRRQRAIEGGEACLPALLAVDEAPAVQSDMLPLLLLQSRSALVSVVTGSQILGEDAMLRGALLGAGVIVAHTLAAPDAEPVAQVWGTTDRISLTTRLSPAGETGDGTATAAEAYRFHPNLLRRLDVGQAALSVDGGRRSMLVQIAPVLSESGLANGKHVWLRRIISRLGRSPRQPKVRATEPMTGATKTVGAYLPPPIWEKYTDTQRSELGGLIRDALCGRSEGRAGERTRVLLQNAKSALGEPSERTPDEIVDLLLMDSRAAPLLSLLALYWEEAWRADRITNWDYEPVAWDNLVARSRLG